MAENSMGKSFVEDFIPELWANRALGKLAGSLNLANTVYKDYSAEVAQKGDVIHVPKRGSLIAYEKATDEPVTKQFPQSDNVDVSLTDHWEVTFLVEDVAKAQADPTMIDGYVQDGALVLAEKVEGALAGLYTEAGEEIDGGSAMDDNDLLEARERLVRNRLPKLATRYGYFDPTAVTDLLKLEKFTSRDYTPSAVIPEGRLGQIYGINAFESDMVATSGSPTEYHNLVYGRDAIALVTRGLPNYSGQDMGVRQALIPDPATGVVIRVSYSWNADYLGVQVTLDVLFGVGVLRPEHVVDIVTT